MPTDNVNSPIHYISHPSGIECIEIPNIWASVWVKPLNTFGALILKTMQ